MVWRLRWYCLAGLVSLFPVAVTVFILVAVFRWTDGLLGRFLNRYWQQTFGYAIPGLGLVMTVLFILGVGMVSTHFLGEWLLRRLDAWLSRLPVVRHIYPSTRQISQFLFAEGNRETLVRGIVLVEYPRPGCRAIALVTNKLHLKRAGIPEPLLVLLVTHAHLPFTGPLIFVPKEAVIPLAITVEDVVKYSVSGGVITPPLKVA